MVSGDFFGYYLHRSCFLAVINAITHNIPNEIPQNAPYILFLVIKCITKNNGIKIVQIQTVQFKIFIVIVFNYEVNITKILDTKKYC